MTNLNDLSKMDDTDLAALEATVREAREQKRDRMDINSIRAGMPPEELARARAEINRVLNGK